MSPRPGLTPVEVGTIIDEQVNRGDVTATIIDPSHIPGRLPDDSVPALPVSLEPGGTTFDPPCRVEFPNLTDLPPGTTVTIFSFEGAVSQFDTLCAGVVTDDGARVVSTEECVSHFSFIGFVPDITGDFESASEAEAFLSGRVVDVDVNPDDPTQFYVAYASGGLWKTTNNGLSFESVFDDQPSMTLGDIAVDWARGEALP